MPTPTPTPDPVALARAVMACPPQGLSHAAWAAWLLVHSFGPDAYITPQAAAFQVELAHADGRALEAFNAIIRRLDPTMPLIGE